MLRIRRAEDIHHEAGGWLDARWHVSFDRHRDRTDQWLQIMGPTGEDGLDLAEDARALVTRLTDGVAVKHSFDPSRAGYLYVIDGGAVAGETTMAAGRRGQAARPGGSGGVRPRRPVGVWAG